MASVVLALIMRKITKPFVVADNQLNKVGATLEGPIYSYFDECMRGSTVIRANDQEDTILKK